MLKLFRLRVCTGSLTYPIKLEVDTICCYTFYAPFGAEKVHGNINTKRNDFLMFDS